MRLTKLHLASFRNRADSTPGIDAESLAGFMETTIRARGFEENLRRLRADSLLVGGKDNLRVAEWLA